MKTGHGFRVPRHISELLNHHCMTSPVDVVTLTLISYLFSSLTPMLPNFVKLWEGYESMAMPSRITLWMPHVPYVIQGGSSMTGTDLCVNKPHCAAAVRP